jgi:ribonuclease Z
MITMKRVLIGVTITFVAVILYQWGHIDGRSGRAFGPSEVSFAAENKETPKYSPVEERARDFYAPNSEDLGPDEMRLIACGTGMPTARPKQAASCWLLELGNGDKFIFDVGTGSAERIAAMQIPYNYLDKVFLSHLHTDHFGDLDALFIGGALAGRQKPLRVWGPKGDTPERGTREVRSTRWSICSKRLPGTSMAARE